MYKKNELNKSISHLVSGAILIAIFVILIFIFNKLPGITKVILEIANQSLTVYHLINLILVVSIITVFFNIHSSVHTLMYNLLNKSGKRILEAVEPFSKSIINIVYVLAVYFILLVLAKRIVELFPSLDYIITILTVALLVALLVFLFFFYQGLRLYLESGRAPEQKTVIEQKPGTFILCPNCGYKNPPRSKFCIKCGAKLPKVSEEKKEKVEISATEETEIECPNCGYKNPPGSKFCIKCGTPLFSGKSEDLKQN